MQKLFFCSVPGKKTTFFHTQTVRARELKYSDNVHPPPTYHMSGVMCQVSGVRCQVSLTRYIYDIFFFFSWTKWWGLSLKGLFSTGLTPPSFYLAKGRLNFIVPVIIWDLIISIRFESSTN